MKSRISVLINMIFFVSVASAAGVVRADDQHDAETRLVGRWQQGLTENLRQLPPDRFARIGFRGDVLEFSADHTVRLYPKCGREKLEWEKRGFSYLAGEWTVTASHQLHLVMGVMGKSIARDVEFQLQGDDLIFVSPSNPHEQFGPFAGKVPQTCVS